MSTPQWGVRNGAKPASPLEQLSNAINDVQDAQTVKKRKEHELMLARVSVKKCRHACDQAEDYVQDAERRLEQLCNVYSQCSKEQEKLEKPLDLTGRDVLASALASTEQSPNVQSESSFSCNPLATATAKSMPMPKGSAAFGVSFKKYSCQSG